MAGEVYTALDPHDALIYGTQIDADLGIADRGRRKMIERASSHGGALAARAPRRRWLAP